MQLRMMLLMSIIRRGVDRSMLSSLVFGTEKVYRGSGHKYYFIISPSFEILSPSLNFVPSCLYTSDMPKQYSVVGGGMF